MGKTILVTGANGQLGRSLQHLAASDQKHHWVFCAKENLDITNRKEIYAFFKQHQPEYCINGAAFTNVSLAEKKQEQAKAINVLAVGLLIAACNDYGTTLIQISTDYVFDGQKGAPYLEEDSVNPLNVYGQTKAESEALVSAKSSKAYIVRTSWVYAKTHGQNFYQTILAKARKGEELKVVDDQIGTPTSTETLARFLLNLIEKTPVYGLYHCSGEKILSWFSFAQQILDEHQLNNTIHPISTPKGGVRRPAYSALRTSKKEQL